MCEAIKTVIVEFLETPNNIALKFWKVCREEIEKHVETRQSFVQDMLAEVNRRVIVLPFKNIWLKKIVLNSSYLEESGNRRMEFGSLGK